MDNVKGYKTSDLPLAGYLYYKGMKILGTVQSKNDENRKFFVFIDGPLRDQLVEEFVTGDDMVSANGYFKATREVRRYLYEEV